MTRQYTYDARTPRLPRDPVVAACPDNEVQRLKEAFIASVEENPRLLVDAYMALPAPDLQDLLLQELKDAPMSPVSQEMRRVVLLFAKERAAVAAAEIWTGD